MKTKLLSILILLSFVLLPSCDQWIDPNLNVDPTAPLDASMDVILPTTQAGMAFVLGGDFDRQISLFTQQFIGTDRQHLGMYRYSIDESTFENAWVTMYTGPMVDLYKMIEKGRATNSPHYQGVAEVLLAYSAGMWTDILGDIPFSQCFKAEEGILKPPYDTQESVYNQIQIMLDSAIIHLGSATSTFKLTSSDFMYGGDKSLWIKAAWTLKARFHLHLKNYNAAIADLANGFTSNDEDLQFNFQSKESESNPLYQFIDQRGDIAIGDFIVDMMNTLDDPRRPAFIVPDTAGKFNKGAAIGPFYSDINSPVPFITYVEAKFIQAECLLGNGDKPGAYTAYEEAIKASMAKFGVASADADAYFTQPSVGVGAGNIALKNIIEQKYIAMFFQSEVWSDWRRTGFPALTPTVGTQIPRRVTYPQNERLFNNENLQKATGYNPSSTFIFTKMWWDTKW